MTRHLSGGLLAKQGMRGAYCRFGDSSARASDRRMDLCPVEFWLGAWIALI